ncbi:MAG TPA: phosphatidylglycerol lysyltransferase domain-containing protein [Candidatus Saccharimonadales bacterium]|nr:phosphatidylglycerol lysyltransferase domain-containing protein [Candidatus Saccharimonadales bacterium]
MTLKFGRASTLDITAGLTAVFGILTLSSTLFALLHLRDARIVLADAHFTVIAGISLIYLSMLLRRGKRNAWMVSVAAFVFVLARNLRHFGFDDEISRHYALLVLTNLLLPTVVLALLLIYRKNFIARSEPLNFRIALRRTAIVLAVAFLYGVVGFQLFDHNDFHQEISSVAAAHYTIDQFGLTTNDRPQTYSRRAVFFVDSLASISLASLAYVALAFFSPVRFRLIHRRQDYADAASLVANQALSSEDFFKLWPRDKAYFFNRDRSAMIAYHVSRRVAMCVGDPLGGKRPAADLMGDFLDFCQTNDWRPALIHTDKSMLSLYSRLGMESQKIGEEALVDTTHFVSEVAGNKYFRNIRNRFTKQGYSFEVLEAPFNDHVLSALRRISDDWLSRPGRAERGFMLGYYTKEYMQKCRLAVVKDGSGEIKAFLNQVPDCKTGEANYDFLRHSSDSPSNINDFLMMNFIGSLMNDGYKKLNMGLCPLSGLENQSDEDRNLVDSVLRFAYANGGRFYSFEGLKRFKSKYEPDWEDRYIVYGGGLAGFGMTMNALLKAMTNVPRR